MLIARVCSPIKFMNIAASVAKETIMDHATNKSLPLSGLCAICQPEMDRERYCPRHAFPEPAFSPRSDGNGGAARAYQGRPQQ